MRQSKIINQQLNTAIDVMGHGDIMMIADAGLPIPDKVMKVDLAITMDYPDIISMLKLVIEEFVYEKCVVAEEQKLYNPIMFDQVKGIITRCPLETVPHAAILEDLRKKAKVIIRTGSYMPWGNIVLVSGIDAPKWFAKEGVIVPDYFQDRVNS